MRNLLAVVPLALAALAAACEASPPRDDSAQSESAVLAERRCAAATTEESCLAIAGCGWGTIGDAATACFYIGTIVPQPGTGDPGGGGLLEEIGVPEEPFAPFLPADELFAPDLPSEVLEPEGTPKEPPPDGGAPTA